jgi:hypothetical protein
MPDMTIRPSGITIFIAAFALLPLRAAADDYRPPARVAVQPVFFVPKGEKPPSDQQSQNLLRHLRWAQSRYTELLGDRDTFTLARGRPQVYQAQHDFHFYRELPEGGAPQFLCELMQRDKCNRWTCPNIYVVVFMNPKENYPNGGARPINGGFNTGGGIVILSSAGLDQPDGFQSTLQHELGHAFGLPHVDAYGYDMEKNPSVMSYNPKHHTHLFRPSSTPGALIPEDIRGLALNRRVFPKLRYDPARDCPSGYTITSGVCGLGPMVLPGQPELVITTTSGEANGTRVANIVTNRIDADEPPQEGAIDADELTTLATDSMWQSDRTTDGWASVEITFPFEVRLTRVVIHSRQGGKHHPAKAVEIAAKMGSGFRDVVRRPLPSVDASVDFAAKQSRTWRFRFKAGKSQSVVIRGLQLFSGDDEIFPSLVPSSK